MSHAHARGTEEFKRLNLLTYNFLIRPPAISYNGNDYKDERIDRFVKDFISDYDVIAFQEVFGLLSGRRDKLVRLGATKGFGYSHMSPAPPLMGFPAVCDGGLLILSRFPIVEKDSFTFSRGMDADQLSCKGALYAKIQLRPKVFIHLFTTHLQANYEKNVTSRTDGNRPNELMRVEQLKMVMRFIRSKTMKDNHAIIFMGDLNINSRLSPVDGHDSNEYLRAVDIMRMNGLYVVHDLLKEASPDGTHDVTICDSYENPDGSLTPTEPQLTPHNEFHLRRSIDYIFRLERSELFFTSETASLMDTTTSTPTSGNSSSGFSSMFCGCSPDIVPVQVRRSLFGHGAGFCGMGDDDELFAAAPTPLTFGNAQNGNKRIEDPYNDPVRKVVRPHPAPEQKNTVVVKFQVETTDPYNQLSDHYGVRSYWRF